MGPRRVTQASLALKMQKHLMLHFPSELLNTKSKADTSSFPIGEGRQRHDVIVAFFTAALCFFFTFTEHQSTLDNGFAKCLKEMHLGSILKSIQSVITNYSEIVQSKTLKLSKLVNSSKPFFNFNHAK